MKFHNTSFLNLTLAGALGAFATTPALAAPAVMPNFLAADSNGDNMVSLQEFQEKGGQEQAFQEGDANRDHRLNKDEYVKAVAVNDRIKADKYMDDALITAKVKALLLKDEGVKGLDVNVETHKGVVQLAGWVNSPGQIAQAEKIARSVEGVKGVTNALLVKR
jgi:hyperosmotically inducible periplasmic protein